MAPAAPADGRLAAEWVARHEFGRLVASLARRVGDLGLAEDCVQDALATALARWPVEGRPANPAGWVHTAAHRRAIDVLRRRGVGDRKAAEAAVLAERTMNGDGADGASAEIPDERLRLIFTCCHPALAPEVRVALTMRLVLGRSPAEIAAAFLVSEAALSKRLVRGKQKIAQAGISFRVPEGPELLDRLDDVLEVIYLVFNEGWSATSGAQTSRLDLCDEAIHLARVLHELMPDEQEVRGLLALLLLHHARRHARVDADGLPVSLRDQDRSQWDKDAVVEGWSLVGRSLRAGPLGPYGLQAAISAVHTRARTPEDTEWDLIVGLYDRLLDVRPDAVVALNRAVAVGERDGPSAGLALLDAPELASALHRYRPYHVARAELLRRLGRLDEAGRSYDVALAGAGNEAEQRYLARRRAELA